MGLTIRKKKTRPKTCSPPKAPHPTPQAVYGIRLYWKPPQGAFYRYVYTYKKRLFVERVDHYYLTINITRCTTSAVCTLVDTGVYRNDESFRAPKLYLVHLWPALREVKNKLT